MHPNHQTHHNNNHGNRLSLPFATANFPEDYLPYTATYSRNKDPYLVWDSGFDANEGHYHHNSNTIASIDSHSPASLNHYHMQSHNHLYPTCSASSSSWPSSKKRKCCGLSCGCCALTLLALIIISALATVVGFSVYLAMITNLHKSSQITLNGSFKVESGDNFNTKLLNISSPEFMRKANKYETIIKTAFETSSVNNAITKQEVYAFRKGSLIVFFRLYLDRRKFDNSINTETRDENKKSIALPFDGVFASKLLQKDLREGISQLKITGTEQIIIDIKSIKVMNDLESMADNNVNDIKTGGIASGSKALAPIKSTKDTKLLPEKSESQPKANITTDKSPMSSTLPPITTTKTKTSAEAEPDMKNTSNSVSTNTTNEIPLISSTLSPTNHSSMSSTSTQSSNESELNVFTSNKSNYNEIKSTTVPPKSEQKNPFLPFTRRQSTAPPVITSTTSSTNIRITTRSRLRSTTSTTTASSTASTTTLPSVENNPQISSTAQSSLSTQQPNNFSNILLKRTEIRDDGLKPAGLDFGQWRPVVPQQVKPQPKPIPPRPIPPPNQAVRPPMNAIPPPNQMLPNLAPGLRPPQQMIPHIPQHIPPQYMPNRPLRVPIPIGIPMREVPRLLDDNNDKEVYTVGSVPVEIERHNTSILHMTTPSIKITTITPTPPTTISPSRSSPTRLSRHSTTTTADPSMVDGFLVPISVSKTETFSSDLRRNKSLNVSNQNKWDYSSQSSVDTSSTLSAHQMTVSTERISELSVGSPFLNIPKPSNKTLPENIKPVVSSDSPQEESPSLAVSQSSNSLEPILNTTLSLELPKTKSPFDYYSVINETLFSSKASLENVSDTTSPVMPQIISSTQQMIAEVSTSNPNFKLVSTSTEGPEIELIAGLPLGIDKLDQSFPQKLIRPIDPSEPAYGERLPKYIPPALHYQKYPTNDILSEGIVANSEDIADEALYDDEINSVGNQSTTLDAINLFSLTTTTSHRLETTTTVSSCLDTDFKCKSGECLSARAHCNRRIECKDGSDEHQCTCAHYLKAERQFKKICDGVIDCYDSTDEIDCSYCKENYVCAQSHVCIDKSKICNGDNDCPNGDDESECISLVPNDEALDTTGRYLNSEGALYIRRKGEWAPLCLDDLNMANDLDSHRNRRSEDLWKVEDLGKAICRANSYSDLKSVELVSLHNHNSKLFFKMEEPNDQISPSLSMWSSLFERSECLSKRTTYVKCKDFECGVRPVTNGIRRRIVGGQSASQGSWPWQVALYREGEFQCGGVIIESEWLLTAAHCFHATRDAYWTARFGILRRGNVFASPYEQLRRITHVLVHNDYVDKGFINDIALLKLDSPINFSKHVRPVCMPSESDDVSKWHRQLCTTVGWGKLFEHGRIFPDTLQEVKLPVISTEECRKRTLFLPLYKITDNMFCAGYDRGGRDACLGDSGGPLMCQKRNGKWFLLGVTSNGDGCGRAGRPGVYTKVAKYKNWIENIINNQLEPEVSRTCDGLRCPLGRCLTKEHICNGIMDCRDASDEQNCTGYIRNTSFNSSEI